MQGFNPPLAVSTPARLAADAEASTSTRSKKPDLLSIALHKSFRFGESKRFDNDDIVSLLSRGVKNVA